MDNERNESAEWAPTGPVIRQARRSADAMHVTEMWIPGFNDPMHLRTFDHPEIYSFVDVSKQPPEGQTTGIIAIGPRLLAQSPGL